MKIINTQIYVWVTIHWYNYYIKNLHNNYEIYDLFIVYYLFLFIDYLLIIYYLLFIYLFINY